MFAERRRDLKIRLDSTHSIRLILAGRGQARPLGKGGERREAGRRLVALCFATYLQHTGLAERFFHSYLL